MQNAGSEPAPAAPSRGAGVGRLVVAAALAGLVACLAAAPASAPGAGPPATQTAVMPPPPPLAPSSLGAGDLFAALTAPDRTAEIDALRAIRRDLTSADDPRQRDAARDRLDALLELEERRQPDVPAALVMSSLAARIDNAIAGLEQNAHAPAPSTGLDWPAMKLPLPRLAMAAALAGLAALLSASVGAGMAAALLGRRRLGRALDAAQAAYETATARLDGTAVRMAQADAAAYAIVETAAAAARDATLAAARLAGATIDTEMRLRDCMDAVDARQRSAGELASQCETVTRNLPALLAGAVEMLENRGLPALDATVVQLQGCAADVAGGVAALHDSTDRIAAAAAGQARLTGIVAQAEDVLAALPDIAGSLAASAAELRHQPAAEQAGMAAVIEDPGQANALTAAIARAEGLVALLPEVTTGLAAAAAQLRRDGQAQGETLAEASAAVAQAAEATRAAGRSAEACMVRWHDAEAGHAAADRALRDGALELRAGAEMLNAVSHGHSEAGRAVSAAAAGLQDVAHAMAAQDTARLAAWQTLAASADAALSALPRETAQLMSAAAVLPAGLAGLSHSAARLQREGDGIATAAATAAGAAREAATELRVAMAALPAAADALAGLAAQAGADIRAAAGEVSEAASSLAADSAQRLAALGLLAARTDAALGALPLEAGQLAAAGAALRHDAEAVRDATGTLIEAARMPASAWSDFTSEAVGGLAAVCGRLADFIASLDGAGAALRDDAARLRQDARDGVQAVRQAGMPASDLAPVLQAHTALETQTARLAHWLDGAEGLALRLEAAAGAAGGPAEATLAGLADAAAQTCAAAAKLAERGEAQAAASARVAQAARELTAAAGPATPSLAWLRGLAAQTHVLLAAAGGMAETALRGDTSDLPPDVATHGPALLAAIETCINGLQGTATALAIASDSARLAA